MESTGNVSFEDDRALVEAMAVAGEPLAVIENYLSCLEISGRDREELTRVARSTTDQNPVQAADIASGDVIEMNPLTSQPQRSQPRST